MYKIKFNKPYFTGNETEYIEQAVKSGKISGNGEFTQRCQSFFELKYGFKKCLLTSSCTDALEMAAILANIKEGDEVIVPTFTFVSTALAFVRQGAKIVFIDSTTNNPNIDAASIENLISEKTKAIVPVHYAGVSCDMDLIMNIAKKHNLLVIEDAAQAIDSYYNNKPLGSFGHFATFSFHETKNIISGEGGMLVINDESFIRRAEIVWEKGTNRASFFRGEVDKYNWVDIGSSFLTSEITAAFLWAQIENIKKIQEKRLQIWQKYYQLLVNFSGDETYLLPDIPINCSNNAHMFYLIFPSLVHRENIIKSLKDKGIQAVSHYLCLHSSPFYKNKHDNRELRNADKYSECLLRVPLFYELSETEIRYITNQIINNV